MKYYEDSCYIVNIDDDDNKEMKIFSKTTDANGNEGILIPVVTLDFYQDTYDFVQNLIKIIKGERHES